MNTEKQPDPGTAPEQPAWGAPPPPPEQRRGSVRRIVVAVAAAVGIAIGAAGGVAVYAAIGPSSDNEPDAGPSGRPSGAVLGGPMTRLEHGAFQNGEVTAISDTSVTLKSEDGYERAYTIDEDTQVSADVEKGDEVMLMATVDGDTATAVSVMEENDTKRRLDEDLQKDVETREGT
jgi:hypothetical protein